MSRQRVFKPLTESYVHDIAAQFRCNKAGFCLLQANIRNILNGTYPTRFLHCQRNAKVKFDFIAFFSFQIDHFGSQGKSVFLNSSEKKNCNS